MSLSGHELIRDWSLRLGLANTPLFDHSRDPNENHFALLDGVEGSFALSTTAGDAKKFLDWSWSSQLASHVAVTQEDVVVRQVESRARPLRFEPTQVNRNLEKFLDTIIANRVPPAMTVSDHFVTCFRAHRHVSATSGLSEQEALMSFLSLLDHFADGTSITLDARLPRDHASRFQEELEYNRLTMRTVDLGLTLRHAAGMVFQETHAELTSMPVQQELFGLATVPQLSTRNRLGAYYTPPGLARVLSDVVLLPFLNRPSVTILDPACGSGIFLVEALNALERLEYKGEINLLGYDVSSSAVEMAKFSLRYAMKDASRARASVQVGDFLELTSKLEADVVLMNPPFLAYQDWTSERVAQAKLILGESFGYRPDLSMLFITKALRHVRSEGALASLLPSGVLEQTNGRNWRAQIAEASPPDLLAVLGDHGLFKDAMVNVAAIVVRKSTGTAFGPTMLWASQKRGASASALRRLRRWAHGDRRPERTSDWAIYPAPSGAQLMRDWTPRPNSLGNLPAQLAAKRGVKAIGDLFQVELGVRAGRQGQWLQVPTSAFDELPPNEKKYFRPVAETKSIRRGNINPLTYVFYPPTPMLLEEAKVAVPTFWKRWLRDIGLPAGTSLELERARRRTNDKPLPKIVSRAFISPDSFAVDPKGDYVAVQGYSWLPKEAIAQAPFEIVELLTDYSFLLNSRLFYALLREKGRIVGGGQVDGAKRHMDDVPLPDLAAAYLAIPSLKAQADTLRSQDRYPELDVLDAFTASAYQTALEEWSIGG